MQDMKITYIGHSGFAVRWDGHAAVFDYFSGRSARSLRKTRKSMFLPVMHTTIIFSRVFSNGRQISWISPTFYPQRYQIQDSGEEIFSRAGLYETGRRSSWKRLVLWQCVLWK